MARPESFAIREFLTDAGTTLDEKVKIINKWFDEIREEGYNEGSNDGYEEGYAQAEEDNSGDD